MPAFLDLAKASYLILGVFAPGEALKPADLQIALDFANRMIGGWRQQSLMAITVGRLRFDLEADKGGIDDPYTIGPGGDFDVAKPPNQNSILAANLILTSPGPPNEVRVPLGLVTDQATFANKIPGMRSGQPTVLYYNATYAGGLGTITLWPVPDVDTNDLELQVQQPLAGFPNLVTDVDLPDGWEEAIIYNLASRLAGPYATAMKPEDKQTAINSLRTIQAANTRLFDMSNDFAAIGSSTPGLYNIETGQ